MYRTVTAQGLQLHCISVDVTLLLCMYCHSLHRYAFGILLYEVITGRRAYAGVPVPLLPHQVAMQGFRPEWPINLPQECQQLRELAELCWQHQPQDR
jgi:hypothetical protein